MTVCCCSLAGTAACRTCTNNPNAETPPPVRTYTTQVTDKVLITGVQTNADRIRSMTDEELAEWFMFIDDSYYAPRCGWLKWLKLEAPIKISVDQMPEQEQEE